MKSGIGISSGRRVLSYTVLDIPESREIQESRLLYYLIREMVKKTGWRVNQAATTRGQCLGSFEMLRSLRHWLRLECDHVRHSPLKSPVLYCPGHSGVKGNDQEDRMANKSSSHHEWPVSRKLEMLRSLRHWLRLECDYVHHSPLKSPVEVLSWTFRSQGK